MEGVLFLFGGAITPTTFSGTLACPTRGGSIKSRGFDRSGALRGRSVAFPFELGFVTNSDLSQSNPKSDSRSS